MNTSEFPEYSELVSGFQRVNISAVILIFFSFGCSIKYLRDRRQVKSRSFILTHTLLLPYIKTEIFIIQFI